MKQRNLIILILTGFFFVTPVQAEDIRGYIGLQFGQLDAETDVDVELDATLARLGFTTEHDWGLEVRTGLGSSDDSVGTVDVELERIYGIYGLYHLFLNERVSFYGALGYSKVTLKVSSDTNSTQPEDNGLSYGVGFEAYGFNVEYMQYIDTTDIDASAVAVGYNYHF